MPIIKKGKNKKAAPATKAPASKMMPPAGDKAANVCCYTSSFARKIMLTLLAVLLVYLIFFVGTLINNNLKKYNYIGQADKQEKTISISGYGKVSSSNDIAVTTLGYSNIDKDVAKAQTANNKVMDAVMKDLKTLGIAEKDLQSNYSIYPEYDYSSSAGRSFSGYRVSNQVTIKIRDLTKIKDVLALAGKHGANQVSGLSFTIDDRESLKSQARAKALQDAKTKASTIASSLGLKVVSIVSYNEYESSGQYALKAYSYTDAGMGGASGAPTVSSGSQDVEMNVNVIYEVR